MIYNLKNDLILSQDEHKVTHLLKDTVGLSYVTLDRNPTLKIIKLAIIAVSKLTGATLEILNTKKASGQEYEALNSLFDINGDLTPEGYTYSINTFKVKDQLLVDLLDGTTFQLPSPEPVVEPTPEPTPDPE